MLRLQGTLTETELNGSAMILILVVAVMWFIGKTLLRYPRIRRLCAWCLGECLARWIDPDGWNETDRWDELRREAARRLRRLTSTLAADRSPSRFEPVSSEPSIGRWVPGQSWNPRRTIRPRADVHPGIKNALGPQTEREETTASIHMVLSANRLIKSSDHPSGMRALQHESKVLTRLHQVVDDSSLLMALPKLVHTNHVSHQFEVVYEVSQTGMERSSALGDSNRGTRSINDLASFYCRTLDVLGLLHEHGMLNASLTPCNLMYSRQNQSVLLCDWTLSKRLGRQILHVPRPFRRWYPNDSHLVAEPSLDIYLSAKVMQSILQTRFGDTAVDGKHQNRVVGDADLLAATDQFLRSCLFDSPRMRPNNASELRDEFVELLGRVGGSSVIS